MEITLALLIFGPLLAAAVAGLLGRRIGDGPSMGVTTGVLFLSCALAWVTFFKTAFGGAWSGHHVVEFLPFINVGEFRSAWSARLDTLSAVMLVVITSVSSRTIPPSRASSPTCRCSPSPCSCW